MAVQSRGNIDTTPFILMTRPTAFRSDDATIEQDAARATALAQFTLMAKKPVTIPTTMTADGGNTGDGTVTAVAAAVGGSPMIGTWELELIGVVTNGGIFKLTDPNGNIVDNNLVLNVGAGAATVFTVAGITFTVTDGATDFDTGDLFTLAVTANGKWVPFDIAGADGSEWPKGIYMGDDITAAALVAGDVVDSPILFKGATVDDAKLVFDDGASDLDTLLYDGRTVRDYLAEELDIITTGTQTASAAENA